MKILNPFKLWDNFVKRTIQKRALIILEKRQLKERVDKAILDYANVKANPNRFSKKMRNLIEIEFRELVELGYIEYKI